MKKQLLFISLLSAGFILSSCGEKPAESSNNDNTENSSSKVEEKSSSNAEASSESSSAAEASSSKDDTSSSDDEIEYATAWSEDDLADMSTYIKTGYVLPFAKGLTTDYINDSGELSDGSTAFVVYDYLSGDLSTSYAKTLSDNGFELDYVGDDDGMPYYNYYFELTDETALVCVQFYYAEDTYGESFNIFAWYQEGGKSAEFPYSSIQAHLDLEITLNTTNLPSFTLDEGEKYDHYPSDDYYCVGGYFDSSVSDDDYASAYEAALSAAGYTVDSANGDAINETLSLEIQYMAYYGYFFIQVSNYVPAPEPTPGDKTTTISSSLFATSYSDDDSDLTIDSINFKFTLVCDGGGYVQFKKNAGTTSNLYNVTSMGELTSFVITVNANNKDYYNPLTLCVSSSQITSENAGTEVTGIYDKDALTYTYNVPAGNSYFKLFNEGTKYASKNNSIVINYTIE